MLSIFPLENWRGHTLESTSMEMENQIPGSGNSTTSRHLSAIEPHQVGTGSGKNNSGNGQHGSKQDRRSSCTTNTQFRTLRWNTDNSALKERVSSMSSSTPMMRARSYSSNDNDNGNETEGADERLPSLSHVVSPAPLTTSSHTVAPNHVQFSSRFSFPGRAGHSAKEEKNQEKAKKSKRRNRLVMPLRVNTQTPAQIRHMVEDEDLSPKSLTSREREKEAPSMA